MKSPKFLIHFNENFDPQSSGLNTVKKIINICQELGFNVLNYHNPKDNSFILNDVNPKDCICLQTDTQIGLPRHFPYAIRYLGNKPGRLPVKSFGPFDATNFYTFVHSRIISTTYPRLLINNFDFELFYNDSIKKSNSIIYLGKSEIYRELDNFELLNLPKNLTKNSIILDRSWPPRRLFSSLLRSTEHYISFDPLSLTNLEANLCGIPANLVLRDNEIWQKEEIINFELPTRGLVFNFDYQQNFDTVFFKDLRNELMELSLNYEREDLIFFINFLEEFLFAKENFLSTVYDKNLILTNEGLFRKYFYN
jgi:hypothetical protein